jgi:hypothetical protein
MRMKAISVSLILCWGITGRYVRILLVTARSCVGCTCWSRVILPSPQQWELSRHPWIILDATIGELLVSVRCVSFWELWRELYFGKQLTKFRCWCLWMCLYCRTASLSRITVQFNRHSELFSSVAACCRFLKLCSSVGRGYLRVPDVPILERFTRNNGSRRSRRRRPFPACFPLLPDSGDGSASLSTPLTWRELPFSICCAPAVVDGEVPNI